MEFLATFHTHYGAMRFLKHCKKNKIDAKMLPVPRELSASCGVCVRFEVISAPPLSNEHVDLDSCYIVKMADNGNNRYEKWIQEI